MRVEKSKTTITQTDPSLNFPVVLRAVANDIAGDLVRSVYPMRVLQVQSDGYAVLNYGQGSIVTGQIMQVFARGDTVRDGTRTLEVENPVGFLRVADVGASTSRAMFAGGGCGPLAANHTVRPIDQKEAQKKIKDFATAVRKKQLPACPAGTALTRG